MDKESVIEIYKLACKENISWFGIAKHAYNYKFIRVHHYIKNGVYCVELVNKKEEDKTEIRIYYHNNLNLTTSKAVKYKLTQQEHKELLKDFLGGDPIELKVGDRIYGFLEFIID